MSDKNTEIKKDIDTSNIFDDFTEDSSLINEVEKIKNDRNRDIFFYLTKIGHYLQIVFWLSLVAIIIINGYIYIQNNESIKNSSTLDPFCPIILGDIKYDETYCSSISYLKSEYTNKLSTIKTSQINEILTMIERLYIIENFTQTKEILFLKQKSDNKLPVLSILEEFDNIKNEFDNVDKQKIQCSGLYIDANKEVLSMNCVAYSAGFEKGLRGFDGTDNVPLKGSSLSIANSFINFIETQSDIFNIIDRQKIFKKETTLGLKTDFTNMTTFNLKLKYNLK